MTLECESTLKYGFLAKKSFSSKLINQKLLKHFEIRFVFFRSIIIILIQIHIYFPNTFTSNTSMFYEIIILI